jgi:uncharacterized integral membrane protein
LCVTHPQLLLANVGVQITHKHSSIGFAIYRCRVFRWSMVVVGMLLLLLLLMVVSSHEVSGVGVGLLLWLWRLHVVMLDL